MYETKVILRSLAIHAVCANSVEQLYEIIRSMANVEEEIIPEYEKAKAMLSSNE